MLLKTAEMSLCQSAKSTGSPMAAARTSPEKPGAENAGAPQIRNRTSSRHRAMIRAARNKSRWPF